MKRELVPVGTMRSIQELLDDKRCLSVNIVTTVSKQLADYLRLLHESFLALDQINETNIYIKFDKTKVLIYLFYIYIKTLYLVYQLCKNHYMKQTTFCGLSKSLDKYMHILKVKMLSRIGKSYLIQANP
jgi:hypothetical protein